MVDANIKDLLRIVEERRNSKYRVFIYERQHTTLVEAKFYWEKENKLDYLSRRNLRFLSICSSIRLDIVQSQVPHLCKSSGICRQSRPFTTPQPHCLAILLKLGDELIALLDHIIVLLILIIWSVGLNDALSSHTVNGAGNTFGCNKFGEITETN